MHLQRLLRLWLQLSDRALTRHVPDLGLILRFALKKGTEKVILNGINDPRNSAALTSFHGVVPRRET